MASAQAKSAAEHAVRVCRRAVLSKVLDGGGGGCGCGAGAGGAGSFVMSRRFEDRSA